jgi:hypothetical protein
MNKVNLLAGIAQSVEQRTENPRVGGSSPPPGIEVSRIKVALELISRAVFYLGRYVDNLDNLR